MTRKPSRARAWPAAIAALCVGAAPALFAAIPEDPETAALLALLDETQRDGARLLAVEDGERVPLREGTGPLVCELDPPGDERYSATCYHRALEPYLVRSRELTRAGVSLEEARSGLAQELAAGTLEIPDGAYQLFVSGTRPGPSRLPARVELTHLVYLPMRRAEQVGLPDRRPETGPWLHNGGTVDAHVMWSEERSFGRATELAQRVDAYLAGYVAGRNFNGTVLISLGDEILVHRGYGAADLERGIENGPETRFHVASLSKSFTAAAVLQLVDRERLRLDQAIADLVPGQPGGDRITVHHLLTHTSGIPDLNRLPEYGELSRASRTPAELAAVIARHPPQGEPGIRYAYSNSNYNLLALILERLSGRTYGEYIRDELASPLGLGATGHDDGEPIPHAALGYIPADVDGLRDAPTFAWSVKTGNGSLYSTAADIRRWARGVATSDLLSERARELMFTPHVEGRIGYGWFVGEKHGRRIAYMNGNSPGFSAYVGHYPGDDAVIVVLANNDIPLATSIGADLAAMLFGESYHLPEPLEPVPLEAAALEGIAGRYRFPYGMAIDLAARDGGLFFESVWPRYPSQLIPLAPSEFFHRFYWDTLVLDRERPAAPVRSVHWKSSPGVAAVRETADR